MNDKNFWSNIKNDEFLIHYDKFALAENELEFFDCLRQLENEFIKPLIAAIKARKINSAALDYLSGSRYQFSKINFYRFGRR